MEAFCPDEEVGGVIAQLKDYLSDRTAHRQTFALAIPMILSNLTVPITGFVDTAVIGHLEHAHFLGATAVGSLIVTMIMWSMGFLRMSTTGLTAQAMGAESGYKIRQSLYNAVLLALLISFLILLFQRPLWSLAMMFMQASEQVQHYATVYFDIRIWAIPAMLLRYVFIGWLIGMQNARMPLVILLVSNLVNIGLDIWLVVELGWGIEGAAWASVIADYCGFLVGCIAVYLTVSKAPAPLVKKRWFELAAFKRLLGLNRDIFIRTLALEAVFYTQTSVGASLGDVVLAANAVLMNFVMIMSYGLDGFANAVEALAGKAYGKNKRHQFYTAVITSGFWSLICSLCILMVYWLAGDGIIRLMTSIPEVQQVAQQYLVYLVFIPLIAVWSYWLDGVFIGITKMKEMRDSMLIALVLVFIPVIFSVSVIGNHGIWIAFCSFMLMRAAGLAYYLVRLNNRNQLFKLTA